MLATQPYTDIHTFLEQHNNKELLRFVAIGSVDDGKSTLIGRLLHDTHQVYEDQLADARAHSADGEIDFARITDGLSAEREQGITIDVAYRYFATEKRKFIIADTPGHIQYTRNMATGASTADVAIILIDARLGVLQQSKRHAYIASLLGIPYLAVAINKMDLLDFDPKVFYAIQQEFLAFAEKLEFVGLRFFPISALKGDNLLHPSERTPWYTDGPLLRFLEEVPLLRDVEHQPFRFPVQLVLRPHLDYRGFAGTIASGVLRTGDSVTVFPSGKTSRIKAIDTYEGPVDTAFAPQSVVLRITDEVDISRGDMLVRSDQAPPYAAHTLDATVVWLDEQPLDPNKAYQIKHTTRSVKAHIERVHWKSDPNTLDHLPTTHLALNEIGRLSLTCHRPLFFDPYKNNRHTGAFILIDTLTNHTVAAGMLLPLPPQEIAPDLEQQRANARLIRPRSEVSQSERTERLRQHPVSVWLSGLPGAGRTALAYALERRLFDLGYSSHVIGMTQERLLHSAEEAAMLCRQLNNAGLLCIYPGDSHSRSARDYAREIIGSDRFLCVDIDVPQEVCLQRLETQQDPRVPLFHRSAPLYEPPHQPDLRATILEDQLESTVHQIVSLLRQKSILLPVEEKT